MTTRPTSDSHRAALFNILDNGLAHEYHRVLDLFSGSGALMLEALSRGATFALAIEADREALRSIEKNISDIKTELEFEFHLVKSQKIEKWTEELLKKVPPNFEGFDLLLCDPPYGKGLGERALKSLLGREDLIAPECLVYLEAAKEDALPSFVGWELIKDRQKGASRQMIFRRSS